MEKRHAFYPLALAFFPLTPSLPFLRYSQCSPQEWTSAVCPFEEAPHHPLVSDPLPLPCSSSSYI
jgi:hypothetical protein